MLSKEGEFILKTSGADWVGGGREAKPEDSSKETRIQIRPNLRGSLHLITSAASLGTTIPYFLLYSKTRDPFFGFCSAAFSANSLTQLALGLTSMVRLPGEGEKPKDKNLLRPKLPPEIGKYISI